MHVQRLNHDWGIPTVGDPFVSAAQSHCPTTARLHLSQDVILLLSKCPQKRPEIEKMVPLEPHGLEQDVHQHLFQGCQQFAFGIIDPHSHLHQGLHEWMRHGRTQAHQVSWAPRPHPVAVSRGAAPTPVPNQGRPAGKASGLGLALRPDVSPPLTSGWDPCPSSWWAAGKGPASHRPLARVPEPSSVFLVVL